MKENKSTYKNVCHGIEASITLLAESFRVPTAVMRARVCNFLVTSTNKKTTRVQFDEELTKLESPLGICRAGKRSKVKHECAPVVHP